MQRSAYLVLPAALLASPLASASSLADTAADERAPNSSCTKPGDPTQPCLVVYEYDHPSGDVDLRAREVLADGTVSPGVLIPASSYDDEINPALASNVDDRYLLVWEHVPAAGTSEIRARWLDSSGFAVGSAFTVASSGKNEHRPAVACDRECLVVWEHEYAPGDADVYARRYDRSGNPRGSAFVVRGSSKDETRPAVDHFGDENPTYYVAWQEEYSAGDHDIHAAFVGQASVSAPVTVANTSKDETNPVIACRFERSCFVVNEFHYAPGDRDVWGHLLDTNASVITPTISSMSLVSSSLDEHGPAIDRDAVYEHDYTVTWEADTSATASELVVQQRSIHDGTWQAGLTVGASAGSNADPRRPTIAGHTWDDFVVAWQERGTSSSLDIESAAISFP